MFECIEECVYEKDFLYFGEREKVCVCVCVCDREFVYNSVWGTLRVFL